MAEPYNHRAIEQKWRDKWEANPINVNDGKKPKYYCLDMFPYPSGSGLHVGHWRGYVISDVWSRYKMLQGYYLIHPMGWDAFGLPAENYAIKMGTHPKITTASNIKNIKRQINEIAAIYDWDMEVNTTDPNFYKWTQWIFVKMFKAGLAYEKEMPINWCPSCKTGLANEEVVDGCCERCGSPVTKKNLKQWMLRITKYADRLLNDLDKLDWPEKVKKMQTDWIGKSYGAEVEFPVEGKDEKITVYTTRPDTLHGATFMVLAPEHAMAKELATDETREAVEKYIFNASMKSNVDRLQDKEKTGVFTGSYAINPLNGAKVPIWLSDYVLADYGTGAIMCVPAHDDRDFEFAKKFDLPIIPVISPDGNPVENSNIRTNTSLIQAKVPVLTTREVELAVEFSGVPGAAMNSIKCDITPKTVRLNGEADVLDSIDKLVLATLHVDDLELHQQNSYVVTPPDGTWLVNGNEVATADITLEGIEEKSLTATSIEFDKLPSGLYAIAPDGGLTVRLWGLSEEIEAVTAENLRVIADMSAVTGQGTVTVPVTVTISGFNDVTVRGTYELTVTVTDVAPTVPETAEGAAASHPAA